MLLVLSTERCEGCVHCHHVRGGVQFGETRCDWASGERPASAYPCATMEKGKQNSGKERGETQFKLRKKSKESMTLIPKCFRFNQNKENPHSSSHFFYVYFQPTQVPTQFISSADWFEIESQPHTFSMQALPCLLLDHKRNEGNSSN